jgi:hypothetical protein
MVLLVSPNGTPKVKRDAPRLVKPDNLAIQFGVQPIRGDRHLNNKGIFLLVGERFTGAINRHFSIGSLVGQCAIIPIRVYQNHHMVLGAGAPGRLSLPT